MKLLELKCPNCSSVMKSNLSEGEVTCEYCGTKFVVDNEVQYIQYDNAEQAGYDFEKGRIKAQNERKAQKTIGSSSKKQASKIRALAGCGMLTAVAVVLQYLEFPIPIVPSFIKLDFSDLPELIAAFAYGPIAGIAVALFKNLIHMAVSQSGFVGELSNFILGAVFAGVAGIVYKKNRSKKGALLGGFAGALAMAIVSVPSNYFLIYPLYYNVLGFPEEAVLGMYQALLPSVKSIFQSLLIFNLPFTFVKGLFSVIISMLIYKPLSPILHGKNNN